MAGLIDKQQLHASLPPAGCDVASVALAAVGGVLIGLPILGAPLSALGVVVGLLGLLSTNLRDCRKVTPAFVGCLLSAGMVLTNLILYLLPSNHPQPSVSDPRLAAIDPRLATPPPAPPASGPRRP
jgi:hypothetical protein